MNQENGYFTVEAALVMPVVIGVVLLTIYFFFFQYNRCLLEQDIGALALKGCTIQEEDKEVLWKQLKQHEDEIYWNKYMLWKEADVAIELTRGEVKVSASGEVKAPFMGLWKGQSKSFWQVETSYTNQRMEPVKCIRMYRRLAEGE